MAVIRYNFLIVTAILAISSAVFAAIPGTYVDASPSNTSSLTNPWYLVGDGVWHDNLWAYRSGYGSGNSVFEAGPLHEEDCPLITTSVSVPTGDYHVYVIYWVHNLADNWEISAAISGNELQTFGKLNGTSTGLTQQDGNLIQMYAYLGTVSNVSQISVDIDCQTTNWGRTWFDGISYVPVNGVDISGVYVDAALTNTSAPTSPWYVLDTGPFDDGLWTLRNDYGIENTVFEAGPTTNETVPTITTTIPVGKSSYKVYAYFWTHTTLYWGIYSAIQGRPMGYYWHPDHDLVTPTGLTQQDGNLIHCKAYLGDAIDTTNINVDVNSVYWGYGRAWFDGISYETIDVSIKGTYVDATPANTTSTTSPFYVTGGGDFEDNLWALRDGRDAGINESSFESGPISLEDSPKLTTSVSVPTGNYNVYIYFWGHAESWWAINASLSGQPMKLYYPEVAVDTGYRLQGGNLFLFRCYVGTVSNTNLISVDIDQSSSPNSARTRYDGISYEPIDIVGTYVDASPANTTAEPDPWYVQGGGDFYDNLWALRDAIYEGTQGLFNHGLNDTSFESGAQWLENTPTLTTSVNVPTGAYAVFGYYWQNAVFTNWGIRMGLTGKPLVHYTMERFDTGARSTNNNALFGAPIGLLANVSTIGVDVQQTEWTTLERSRFDGISYEPIPLTGSYVDADENNTILKGNPSGTWLGDQGYYDDLWEKRIGYGFNGTVFEGGPYADDPENVWENVPVITTSATVPTGNYAVYVYFWSSALGQSWGIAAAISDQPLVQFSPNNSQLIYTYNSEWELRRAFLGYVMNASQISVDVDGWIAPFWSRTWYDGIGYEPVSLTTVPVSQAKVLPNGSLVKVTGLVVSAIFGDTFYAQAADRSSGIQVRKPGHGMAVGNVVEIIGIMASDSITGERYIDASAGTISAVSGPAPIPLTMPNKSLAGGDFGVPPQGQPGASTAAGLNNVGLYVRTTGSVVNHTSDGFIIDDGSNVTLKVVWSGTLPDISTYVTVTGVSTLEKVGTEIQRLVRATSWN